MLLSMHVLRVVAWLSGSALVSINDASGPTSTGMGNRLRVGKPLWCVTSHSGQLSLLPSVGRKMSTGQSVDKCVGDR